ncbi:MAG TPA: FkbM family methyltransferase [Pyrinomonadaceae bacterium]|nr:FkbM family methyltransferase [Pyrinomonadaceae bacterium]
MTDKVQRFVIDGFTIDVADKPVSRAANIIAWELDDDCYGLKRIDFKPGDVVIDIGAHIGFFAIYTALRFPEVVIHSFEPFPENYELLQQNLVRNGITNVRTYQVGVSGSGRPLEMVTNPQNSGSSTCYSRTLEYSRTTGIPSNTLDHIFDSLRIGKCKLLKIDCEGSEYEILFSTRSLAKVEYLSGEFHQNKLLLSLGYTFEGLLKHCQDQIAPDKLSIKKCDMGE